LETDDELEEPTLNAVLAIIDSMRPQSELEALLAVQIVATSFSGLRFLRQSQTFMTKDFIDVPGKPRTSIGGSRSGAQTRN
jgi:hypothetical protein